METTVVEERAEHFRQLYDAIEQQVRLRIVGLSHVVEYVLNCLFLGGHVLLEGVPGLGKTLLVKTLAEALDLQFARIQFTPDLMPADILGTNMIVEDADGGKTFRFQRGPIFTHILLADEINRATPKTQSALLEAMQERSVTVAGVRHALDSPFYVLATQNPIEMEGTYPLPEAQLDRFLYKLIVPYPSEEELLAILNRTTADQSVSLQTACDRELIQEFAHFVLQVPVAEPILKLAGRMVLMTHPDHPEAPEFIRQYVRYGSSPRGAQALILSAKIRALREGRFHVSSNDLHAGVLPCLRHRLILNMEGLAENVQTDSLVQQLSQHLQNSE